MIHTDVGLWNIIRDFFVRNVFGGFDTEGVWYDTFFGLGQYFTNEGVWDDSTNAIGHELLVIEFPSPYENIVKLSISDWLSTTATIITLVGLFIAITLLIISLFKWIVRLVSLRG